MILGELKIGKHQAKCRSLPGPGVSILTSYGENPHYVKLPIFSEFMENSSLTAPESLKLNPNQGPFNS